MLVPDEVTLPTTLGGDSRAGWRRSRALWRRSHALWRRSRALWRWARWLASLVALALATIGLRSLRRVEVTGYSMSPVLLPGDRLVVYAPPFGWGPCPNPGQVVAVRDPRRPDRILIKRVGAVHVDAGTVEVVGDDRTASTDSRTFGAVPLSSILGRAVYRYAPGSRRGPIAPLGEYHRA